jgi:hypothetical protein
MFPRGKGLPLGERRGYVSLGAIHAWLWRRWPRLRDLQRMFQKCRFCTFLFLDFSVCASKRALLLCSPLFRY